MHQNKMRMGIIGTVAALAVNIGCFLAPMGVIAEEVTPTQPAQATQAVQNAATEQIVVSAQSMEGAKDVSGETAVVLNLGETKQVSVEVPVTGTYTLGLRYHSMDDKNTAIVMSMKVDGAYPLEAMERLEYPKMWVDDGESRVDGAGNEFAPTQKVAEGYFVQFAMDTAGNQADPYAVELTAGTHTLELAALQVPVAISQIIFGVPETAPTYEEYLKQYADKAPYDGEPLLMEGEDAVYKTTSSLIPMADNSDPGLSPSDPIKSKLNYIGGGNWKSQGETLTWKVKAEKSGFFKLGIWYRQSGVVNGNSYRWLKIDGVTPFEEAKTLAFPYTYGWQFVTFGNEDGEPYQIYLEEGEHELSMSVTLGELAEIKARMEAITEVIGDLYVSITMITGDTVDVSRDYQLFNQIPNFNETLQETIDTMIALENDMKVIFGQESNSYIAQLENMRMIMKKMLDNPYNAHNYKSNYYTTYTGLAATVSDLANMPADIDRMMLVPSDYEFTKTSAGFFEKIAFGVERFISSFFEDYNNISGDDHENSIEIWVNWGRDQAQVLNSLIQENFTQQENIGVSVKITNASIIQGILSGNGPDCSLILPRTEPVNLAMRGGLYDLSQFDDFEEVKKRFMPDATIPYQYKNGTYALPDGQGYYMLFYRTDIFEDMGLSVPKTWDEFISVSKKLQKSNLKAYLPYTQIADMTTVNTGVGGLSIFPSMLLQSGQKVYKADKSGTTLLEPKSIDTFTFWTDFYTKLKFDISQDFYNRFRVGTTPMGVSVYTLYNTLTVTAPEIDGCWAMAPIPGTVQEDGTVDNTCAGSGSGCAILNLSENKPAAWKFLKWWTSAETQLTYSNNVESLLGPIGRHGTSNIEAFQEMAWEPEALKQMMAQWEQVTEIEELPGSYYVSRGIDQAYWNIVNQGESAKDMLFKWSKIVDAEIQRKGEQYGV